MRWLANLKEGRPESRLWKLICDLEIQVIKWDLLLFVGWWFLTIVTLARERVLNLNHPTVFRSNFVCD